MNRIKITITSLFMGTILLNSFGAQHLATVTLAKPMAVTTAAVATRPLLASTGSSLLHFATSPWTTHCVATAMVTGLLYSKIPFFKRIETGIQSLCRDKVVRMPIINTELPVKHLVTVGTGFATSLAIHNIKPISKFLLSLPLRFAMNNPIYTILAGAVCFAWYNPEIAKDVIRAGVKKLAKKIVSEIW